MESSMEDKQNTAFTLEKLSASLHSQKYPLILIMSIRKLLKQKPFL